MPDAGLTKEAPLRRPLVPRLPPASPDWDKLSRGERERFKRALRDSLRPYIPLSFAGVQKGLTGTPTINSTAGTSCSPAIPGSISAGHYMVLTVAISGNKVASLNTPAGWTMLGSALNNGTSCTLVNYGRFWQSGDSNPSVTWTTNNKNIGVINTYTGVDATTPMDIAVPAYATGSSASAAAPSATVATMGAMRLCMYAKGATGAWTPDFRVEEMTDSASSTSSAISLQTTYEGLQASDASGTRTSTIGSTAWVASTILLRPATPSLLGLLRSARGNASGTSATATLASADVANSPSGTFIVGVAAIYTGGTNTVTGVSYTGSVSMTKATSGVGPSTGDDEISIWYKLNATVAGAATTVTFTRSGSDSIDVYAAEFKGLTTSAIDTAVSNPSSSGSTTATVSSGATQSTTELVLAAATDDTNPGNFGGDSNYFTGVLQTSGATGRMPLIVEFREVATGGASQTWTSSINASNNVAAMITVPIASTAITITAAETFDAMLGSAASSLSITGSASKTLSDMVASASITISNSTSASASLASMSGASSVSEQNSATASASLDSMSGVAAGYAFTPVSASALFDSMSGSSAVSVQDTLSADASFSALTGSASSAVGISAQASSTFSSMSGASSATEANAVDASAQLAGTSGAASVSEALSITASSSMQSMSGSSAVSVSDTVQGSATFDSMSNLGSLVDRARMTLETREWKALTSFPSGFEPREFSLVYSASDSMWYLFSTHPADGGTVMYSASTLEDLGAATPVTVSASSLWYPNAVKSGTTWYVFGTTGAGQSGFITSSSTPPGSWSAITNLRAGLFNLDLNDPSVVKINIGGTSYWLLAAITANATTPDGRLILRIYRHADPPSATGWTLLESGVEDIFQNIGVPSFASVNAFNPNIIALNGRYYMGFEGDDGSSTTTGLVEIDLHDSPPVGGYAVGEVVVLSSSSLGGTDWADITFIQCPDGVDRIFGASAQNLGALELYPDTAASSSVEASASSVFDSMVGTSSVSEAVEISASSTLQDMSGAALIEATAANEASASATFDAMQSASSVQSRIDISASSQFSPLGGSSSVTEAISAIASATLDSMSSAAEIVQIEGNGVSADITFSPMLGSSSVTNGVAAQSSSSLSPMVGTASAQSSDTAQGSATFSPTIASSAVASTVSAQGQATFSPMIGAASLAYAPNSVSASGTLDAMLGIASASLSVGVAASPTLSSMIGASSLALSVEAAFSELLEDMSGFALMRFVAQATRAHGEISERSRFSGNITERDITGVTIEETSVLSIASESALSTAGAIEASRYSGRATEE